MPHKNIKKARSRWLKSQARNINHQTLRNKRNGSRIKRVAMLKKLERKGLL
jgi:hypothetical protein